MLIRPSHARGSRFGEVVGESLAHPPDGEVCTRPHHRIDVTFAVEFVRGIVITVRIFRTPDLIALRSALRVCPAGALEQSTFGMHRIQQYRSFGSPQVRSWAERPRREQPSRANPRQPRHALSRSPSRAFARSSSCAFIVHGVRGRQKHSPVPGSAKPGDKSGILVACGAERRATPSGIFGLTMSSIPSPSMMTRTSSSSKSHSAIVPSRRSMRSEPGARVYSHWWHLREVRDNAWSEHDEHALIACRSMVSLDAALLLDSDRSPREYAWKCSRWSPAAASSG